MEFDLKTNTLKRRKLISQSEALASQFSVACSIADNKETKGQIKEQEFTLGINKKVEEDKKGKHVVTLRKFMTTEWGKSEKDIK